MQKNHKTFCMKLNAEENLKNMFLYFHEVWEYNCCTFPKEEYEDTRYLEKFEPKMWKMEVPSVMHMLRYSGDFFTSFNINDVLEGKQPIPEIAYKLYGTHEEAKHDPPCFVAAILRDDAKWELNDGTKQIYFQQGHGMLGREHDLAFDYFMYCYHRSECWFQAIPPKMVEHIESFLKSRNREIYDCL